MKLSDICPPGGRVQRLYCDACHKHLDLTFVNFREDISGIDISVAGLPVLRCHACDRDYLPDRSRVAIIKCHEQATEKGQAGVAVTRRKPNENFGFTNIPFLYDSDDYRYIPGLERSFDVGFLTPVFFKREVLLKYDASPTYRVKFVSPTYGDIMTEMFAIPFGINRNGKLMMWLGDIAKLPDEEQYYLRSENVASDHAIGSDFYDAQIECVFTEPTQENKLFGLRSQFVEACFERSDVKIAHLDNEVVNLALDFNPPTVDTEKERKHVADSLNKIYIESFDNAALGNLLARVGGDPKGLGSLKRLQGVLQTIADGTDTAKLLSPFYVLYDLRVAYLHLTSMATSEETLDSVTRRLGLNTGAGMLEIYNRLLQELTSSFEKLTALVKAGLAADNDG